jgi:hypothetical protein
MIIGKNQNDERSSYLADDKESKSRKILITILHLTLLSGSIATNPEPNYLRTNQL